VSLTVQSPVSGVVVALSDVPDPVFSGKIVGPGVAITPDTADRGGGGRRGPKTRLPQGRAVSTPAAGIVLKTRFSDLVFFFYLLNL